MGFDTTVVFNMDAVDGIKTDPKFSENLYYALLKGSTQRQLVSVPIGGYTSGAVVVESHHGDLIVPVMIGAPGGMAIPEAAVHYNPNNVEGCYIELLKNLADHYGYRLIRKSNKVGDNNAKK
jgi:hypothetical protein